MTCATPPAGHRVLKLPVRSLSVAAGRRFVMGVLAAAPDDHVWAVVQCTSELLTNALAAAERCAVGAGGPWRDLDTPVHLAVRTTDRWTRIDVRDPETVLHPGGPHGTLDEDGRGLGIVMALGHFTHTVFDDYKIVYALMPVGDPLTEDERAVALPQRARIGGEVTP